MGIWMKRPLALLLTFTLSLMGWPSIVAAAGQSPAVLPSGPQPLTQTDGNVAVLTGTCPELTFQVTGVLAAMNADTVVTGGACSDIANGVEVEVIGVLSNDELGALEVVLKDDPPSALWLWLAGLGAAAAGAVGASLGGDTPVATVNRSGQLSPSR